MPESIDQSFRLLENVIFLKKSSLFSTMRTGELRAVAGIADETVFNPGEEIVREGELGDSMYMIKNGTVKIVKKVGENTTVELARLGAGDCFGDMAIFDAEVRSASVLASDTCTLLRLDSESLMDVLADHPSIAIELLKIFVQRLRKANTTIQDLSANSNKEEKKQ